MISSSGKFSEKAVVSIINQEDIYENFSFDMQEKYIPAVEEIDADGQNLIYSFPPHSFTQVKVQVKK